MAISRKKGATSAPPTPTRLLVDITLVDAIKAKLNDATGAGHRIYVTFVTERFGHLQECVDAARFLRDSLVPRGTEYFAGPQVDAKIDSALIAGKFGDVDEIRFATCLVTNTFPVYKDKTALHRAAEVGLIAAVPRIETLQAGFRARWI